MANLALIKGERDVAPKYLDLGKAIADPFLDVYGKSVALREQQKEVVKRENEIRANEYASIDTVDLAQIGEDLLEGTTIEANNIKNKAFELIKNKANIDPVEYSIQLANLKKDVADLNANIKIKKILGTDYADADQIGQAPWGNNINKQALLAAIDRNVKKEWIKKDGKYFLSTDGGKTLIDLSNITPPETIDYGIGVSIEENAQKMLQNKVALGQRLTDQNIVDTTDLQIRSMNPSQIKSAALHFNVAGNTEESQKNYYTAKSLDQVTADVRNAMVDRLKGIQQGLNAKLDKVDDVSFTKGFTQELIAGQNTANAIINATNQMVKQGEGTANISDVETAIKNLNIAKGTKIQDRNTAMGIYVSSIQSDPENKMSIPEIQDQFNKEFPISMGNLFINGLPYNLNTSDPSKIAKFLFEYSGLSKKVQDYYLKGSFPTNLLNSSTVKENITEEEARIAREKIAQYSNTMQTN